MLWLLHQEIYSCLAGKLKTMVLLSDHNKTFLHLVKQIHVLIHQLDELTLDSDNVGREHSKDGQEYEAKESVEKLTDDYKDAKLLLAD